MSKSTDLLSTLNQQKNVIQDLKTNITKDLEGMSQQISRAIERSDRIDKKMLELQGIEANKDKTLSTLETEVTGLGKEIEQKNTILADLREKVAITQRETEELGKQNAIRRETLKESTLKREKADRDLAEQKAYIGRLEAELQQVVTTHEAAIKALREDVEKQTKLLKEKTASHKAAHLLIHQNALEIPELPIFRAMVGQTASSLEFILRSTGLRQDVVLQTVKGLASRGIIEFTEASGAIKINTPITL